MARTNHKYAVLDTNTLLHFRQPEEVNWREVLEAQTVTVVLMPVVVRELDRHKDLHPVKKLRKRAAALVSKLSKQLDQGAEHELREAVTLRFEAREPVLDFVQHRLRSDQNDDHLIASILQFRLDQPDAQVVLVTADLGLKMKARLHQVEVRGLPDSLKLPDEPDEDQKQIRELQGKLAAHENRLPKLRLVFPEQADRMEIRSHAQMLSEANTKEEVGAHRQVLEVASSQAQLYNPLSPAAERKYQDLLEQHFARYASYIGKREEVKAVRARTIRLDILLFNEGTAPGEDIDVSLLFPPEYEVRKDDPAPLEPTLPTPPKRPMDMSHAMIELAHQKEEMGRQIATTKPSTRPGMLSSPTVSMTLLSKGSEGFKVQFHVGRCKQNQSQSLGSLYVMVSEQKVLKSFQLKYVVNAANLPHEIEGNLHVRVSDAQPIT